MLSYLSLMPAGAGAPGYENEAWSLEVFGCHGCHPCPLDSGFRGNDDLGGDSTGATYFRANEDKRGRIDIGAHRRG